MEIGAFIDGKCVGATVFQGNISEIQLYLEPSDFGKEIEIQFAYNARSPKVSRSDFAVVDKKANVEKYIPLIAKQNQRFKYIKFDSNKKTEAELKTPFIQLHQNYPNPFNPDTRIDFYLSLDDNIKLNVYNIKGQRVKELFAGTKNSGKHFVIWDGKDNRNQPVPSGVYLYKLETSIGSVQRKMLLLK